MEQSKLTTKGQITIPQKVRKALGLETGSEVTFILEGKEAIMLPKTEDPMKELIKLREEVPLFTEEEIKAMIKEKK